MGKISFQLIISDQIQSGAVISSEKRTFSLPDFAQSDVFKGNSVGMSKIQTARWHQIIMANDQSVKRIDFS